MMQKMGLAALTAAVAWGCATQSTAAEVKIYGVLDTGLAFVRNDNGVQKSNTFDMRSGNAAPSRFGFRAHEEFDGLKVGVNLEGGLQNDTGALALGRLFGREASVYVEGGWGRLTLGRSGVLVSGFGSTGIVHAQASPFVGSWGPVRGHRAVMAGLFRPVDNLMTYASPKFAGLQLHAQYSLDAGTDDNADGVEGKGSVDRFYAAGATYEAGALQAVAAVEVLDYARYAGRTPESDQISVTAAGNYKFDQVTVYGLAQWFDHARWLPDPVQSAQDTGVFKKITPKGDVISSTGYGLNAGVKVHTQWGAFLVAVGHLRAHAVDISENDMTRTTASVGWMKSLSKRTHYYVGAGYSGETYGKKGVNNAHYVSAVTGLLHFF